MIVHTAVRSKVPLKKKVRGERSKSKHQPATTSSGVNKDQTNVQTVSPLSTTNTKRSKQSSDSPRKLLKKKKKRSSGTEENKTEMETLPVKPSRKLKKKSKHKEVIDYSNTEHTVNHTNTFGKVQRWLLESPIVSNTPSQIEHSSKTTKILSKSQSTPEQLVLNPSSQNNSKVKTKSVGNLNEKVRLQVVYKPPFKLSLKLSKNEYGVNTSIVKADKRKTRLERKRATATITEEPPRNRRTALLIRTNTDEAADEIEPNYETLNSKLNQRQMSQTVELPNYENMTFQTSPNQMEQFKINSATFRINKGASGANVTKNNLPVLGVRKSPSKGSNQNLSHVDGGSNYNSRERRPSISNSNTNLLKFGSSQNLIRSSTTNLTKKDNVKRRGSAVNQYYRQHPNYGSSSNLRGSSGDIHFGDDYGGSGDRRSHSRRNSTNLSSSRTNLPRTLSNNNLNSGSRKESNIPRASLINPIEFQRQTSLNIKSKVVCDDNQKVRPQTASCEPMNNFEWPKMYSPDEILPSDLEVMCSDVENLMGDS